MSLSVDRIGEEWVYLGLPILCSCVVATAQNREKQDGKASRSAWFRLCRLRDSDEQLFEYIARWRCTRVNGALGRRGAAVRVVRRVVKDRRNREV